MTTRTEPYLIRPRRMAEHGVIPSCYERNPDNPFAGAIIALLVEIEVGLIALAAWNLWKMFG